MKFGDSELMRSKGDIRLLKVGCRDDKTAYCVLGNGSTEHFSDYDDALDEFNERWLKAKEG